MKHKYILFLIISTLVTLGAVGFVLAQFEYYDPYSNSNIDYFPTNPIDTSPRRTGGNSGTNSGSAGKNITPSPTKTGNSTTISTPCTNRPKQNPQNTRSVEIRDLSGKVFYLSPPKEELTELRAYPETSQKIFKMIMDESGMQKDEVEIGLITVDNNCYPKYGYIQDNPPSPPPSPAPSPAPQPSPSPAPAIKSKYKTYTNTSAKYSVKYPSYWRPHEQELYVQFDYGKEQISIPDQSTAVTIGPTPISQDSLYTSENLDEIAKIAVAIIESNKFGNRDLRIRVKNTKVAKIKAKQINYLNSFIYDSDFEMVQFIFVKDGAVWNINGPAKEKGLQKILKSLKFSKSFQLASNNADGKTEDGQPCMKNPNPVFAAHITDVARISKIIPPGTFQGGHFKSHSYIWIADGGKVPVYAPVDAELFSGTYYSEQNVNQYVLGFRVSCEVEFKIDHFLEPIESIRSAFRKTPKIDDTRGDYITPIPFKAGDLLGYTSGTPQAHNWDFGVYNSARPFTGTLPAQAHPTTDKKANCPYDYYPREKRSAYQKLFDPEGASERIPYCE